MTDFKVKSDKGLVLVDRNFLAIFFGKNKNTISNWKNSKNMPVYMTEDNTHYYDLLSTIEWKNINVNERFNPNRDKEIDINNDGEEFKFDLPYGLELADIDTTNSIHLSILAAHPFGQMIRDTLEFKTKYDKSEFELRVKKKEFLKTEELNARMTEFIALVKDSDINARAKFPIEITDEILASGLIESKNKESVQSIIYETIDSVQNDKYKIIAQQFMKHIVGKTREITLDFLDEMKEYIRAENDDNRP